MLKNSFAIVCEWPGVNAAENETILRIQRSAQSIGKTLIVIDKYGNILDENFSLTSRTIQNHDVDFVINLHFATPKCYDGFSYVALWNPIKFYHDWHYKKCSFNLVTHHDFISCLSEPANDHAVRIAHINKTGHLEPAMVLNHTNSGPYYKFDKNKTGIFYCGINWDKMAGKGRFAEIFEILDKENILKIYGPQKLSNGVIPWDGFKSYVDEIPFDGVSTFKEISKCLLGLALSHEAHIESEIASSRVFELIAGGTLPICDENPFFEKYFGKKVLYAKGTDQEKANQIIQHYNWALQNQDQVKKMVDTLQNLMKEKFDLTRQLEVLYQNHQKRRELIEKQYCALKNQLKVNVVYLHFNSQKEAKSSDNFFNIINSIRNQNYQNINLVIASNDYNLKSITGFDDLGISYTIIHHNICGYAKFGKVLDKIKNQLPSEENQLFLITNKYEQWFYDHISSLVRYFEDHTDCQIVKSNAILVNKKLGYGPYVNNTKDFYIADHDFVTGNVMFRNFPPAFITKYLNIKNYHQSLRSFFADGYFETSRVSGTLDIKNDLPEKVDQSYLNKSLFMDYASEKEQSTVAYPTISKDMAYQILSQIKFFRPITKIREVMKNRNIRRKAKKNREKNDL